LKQSEALATASEHKVFRWARLKLTGVYVLILGIILIVFSTILYESVTKNLEDASEDTFSGVESHHHFVEDTLASVRNEILLIDLIILVTAAGVSYVLAGYTLRPIQRSLVTQRQFSESASHELRTPLAVIKNDIEVLLRDSSPTKERIQQTLRSNIEEIDRMSKMTEDLLLIARSENHSSHAMEKIDIAKLVRSTCERLRSLARDKSIQLDVSAKIPVFIKGSETRFERVITNLLQNAIEHTPENGSVTVCLTQDRSEALVTIADTGSGISEKDLQHIFKRFYKGESASGSGLGLSIVKELVTQHGGTVAIVSEQGSGTIVTVKLPAVS
jgi:signal transduction histidine kinase